MNMNYETIYQANKEEKLFGRYITLQHIEHLIFKYPYQVIGKSVLGKPIYKLEFGMGKTKIFMWSQMHGNESTTTKALFDFINFLHSNTTESNAILSNFTFWLLPMLNPDGAELYTRENANKIDLNRDAQNLSQPESVLLREVFTEFKPDFCYNLHDQRTIFGAGDTGKPATVSFLAPAYNDERAINEVRSKAIEVIVSMNETLQQFIPNQIGRFDDSFNINCIGDTFQSMNVPTILFEAGHFQGDYDREFSRKFIFIALLSGIQYINENDIVLNKIQKYLHIPQNKVIFYDFVCKNVKINYDSLEKSINFALQYKEVLSESEIIFEAHVAQINDLENYYGHFEFDANNKSYQDNFKNTPIVGQIANFSIENGISFSSGKLVQFSLD
ncbi:M14 metallopeptidase family protein [Flavobacterium sp.]|uniref:M14 family metallopeptidase n=1 Tax=Flavobacterium sp. TaxID=239 RepID=UPI00338F6F0F